MEFSINPMHRILSEEESVRNLFAKETRLEDLPAIPKFYAGREIFITGGSGFMGKVLIEKLLRSCPDIARIFVLIRSRKGKSPDERLKVITDLPLFGPIRQVMPSVLNKLTAIDGDITELELGLSNEDVERMKNVSIVFHSAASVRFDDPLKYAVFMNTRGTHELFKFVEKLENVAAVLHVSTTYSNPDRYIVEEEIYPPVADWRKTIEICEKHDEDELNSLTGLYTNFMPNTYTFTKNLAEHVVNDFKDKLPLTLFRPSIVISSMIEPFPGWVDNFNGPVGLLVGSGIGITRTMYCNPDNLTDFTPVDVCIKAMIIAAWKRAHEPRGVLPVYNCASSNLVTITMGQVTDIGKSIAASTPLDQMLWTPGGRTTLNRPMNYIKTIFLQLLPALLVDLMLRIKGERTL